jgi:polyisoprenoid-binding protein YceI
MSDRAKARWRAAGFCAGLVALQAQAASAQQPNVDFTVSGTSTIRGWTCTARGVLAATPASGAAAALPGFANGVQSATLTVPVKAFTCPNAEMTEHLLEAMKAAQFQEIVYRVERYDVTGAQVQAHGTMTITGTSLPVSVPVTVKASGDTVQLEGNTRLDMTKYGVQPPVVMLGMLKVGPQIRIEFKGALSTK